MISRREFASLLGVAGAGCWASPVVWAAGQDRFFTWQQISDGVRVAHGSGGNALVVASGDEAMLVDCKSYGLGATLRREAEAGGTRLVVAINTHHHPDHTGGNVAFTGEMPVIAQVKGAARTAAAADSALSRFRQDPEGLVRRMRRRIRRSADTDEGAAAAIRDLEELVERAETIVPQAYAPSETFDGHYRFEVGGTTVELHHLEAGHTDNDVFVWIPEYNLLHAGDLLFSGSHPSIDVRADARTDGWQRCLQAMRDMTDPDTIVVPGHGSVTFHHSLHTQAEYFDRLRDVVEDAINAGMSRQETVESIPLMRLRAFEGLSRGQQLAINLGIIYDEMSL